MRPWPHAIPHEAASLPAQPFSIFFNLTQITQIPQKVFFFNLTQISQIPQIFYFDKQPSHIPRTR